MVSDNTTRKRKATMGTSLDLEVCDVLDTLARECHTSPAAIMRVAIKHYLRDLGFDIDDPAEEDQLHTSLTVAGRSNRALVD